MGCRVCRARKVKCDGRPNGCRNCERLQLDCVGDGDAASVSATSPGFRTSPVSLRKIRTYRSCTNCRLSKTKCNGDRPKCSRCAAKHVDCLYDGGSAPRWTRSLGEASRTGSADGPGSELPADGSVLGAADPDAAPALRRSGSLREPTAEVPLSVDAEMTGTPTQDKMSLPPPPPLESSGTDATSWLLSPDLPPTRQLRRVVEHYFANVHPIRCFAFVHKPSFMRQLDKGFHTDDESALLHIVCAHGAKFHVLSLGSSGDAPGAAFLRAAGNQWARKAEQLMLANFGRISISKLMTAVLLHDFQYRLGEYQSALMLSGLAIRMAHGLKINNEYNADILCSDSNESEPSIVSRESRRRLMWACYVLDAWTGSGVEHLMLLREYDIKIQLPCNERNFGLRIASVTETLGVGHVLQFLHPAVVPRKPAGNMGIMAYYIRIVSLWKKVVKYVSHSDSRPPPWLPESDFAALGSDLRLWRRELPEFVEYSTDTIYARLDSNQLGALVLIHCTYHHNYLELYKVAMPDLFKLRKPFSFPPEQHEFLHSVQADCYHHAHQIAHIVNEAAEHGARLLSDSLLPFFVYDSSRVMLYYVARLLDPHRIDAQVKVKDAIRSVEGNNRVLRMMAPLFPMAESLSTTIERWLYKIRRSFNRADAPSQTPVDNRSEIQEADMSANATSVGSPPRGSPDYVLPPLSLQNLARASERRGAERTPGSKGAGAWSPEERTNGSGGASWDHASAAQQLVGLSQDAPARSGLQHERPVPVHPQLKMAPPATPQPHQQPIYDALDLDDLQNFLSWDMYGIMEISDTASNIGTEVTGLQSWSG